MLLSRLRICNARRALEVAERPREIPHTQRHRRIRGGFWSGCAPISLPILQGPLSQSSNTASTAIYGFPALFRYDSFALVIEYWRCANRGRVATNGNGDDVFVGPGKQRISERTLWSTVKRKDLMNNSLDSRSRKLDWPDSAGLRYRRGTEEQR
jgi:hypothetical protein